MTYEERWKTFITELRAYIDKHHLGPSKHTDLYNRTHYFKRKLREGTLDAEKAKELESVLGMRDLTIHTGGRRRKAAAGSEETRNLGSQELGNLFEEFRNIET